MKCVAFSVKPLTKVLYKLNWIALVVGLCLNPATCPLGVYPTKLCQYLHSTAVRTWLAGPRAACHQYLLSKKALKGLSEKLLISRSDLLLKHCLVFLHVFLQGNMCFEGYPTHEPFVLIGSQCVNVHGNIGVHWWWKLRCILVSVQFVSPHRFQTKIMQSVAPWDMHINDIHGQVYLSGFFFFST